MGELDPAAPAEPDPAARAGAARSQSRQKLVTAWTRTMFRCYAALTVYVPGRAVTWAVATMRGGPSATPPPCGVPGVSSLPEVPNVTVIVDG